MAIKIHVYTTKYTCPHCGHVYEKNQSTSGYTYKGRNFKYYLNSPLITCKKCKMTFVDNRVNEYVNLNEHQRREYFREYDPGNAFAVAIILGAVASIIALIVNSFPANVIVPSISAFVILVTSILYFPRKKMVENHLFDEQIKRSLNRCMNKEYLVSLLYFGFNIYPLSDVEIENNPEFKKINSIIRSLHIEDIKQEIEEEKEKVKKENIDKLKHIGFIDDDHEIKNKSSEYDSLKSICINENDIIALFCDADNNNCKFVKITLGKKETIEKYLQESSGQALKISAAKGYFWYLESLNKRCSLVFRVSESNGYKSIDEKDFSVGEYFISLL